MAPGARYFFTRFLTALDQRDMATIEAMIHPDFFAYSPQSGERSVGFAGFRAQLENYPGGAPIPPISDTRLLGDEDRWAITPAFTVIPLAPRNEFTVVMRAHYPDGSYWRVVSLVELRDDKLYRMENYFAPEFEPPEWRKGIVEIVPRD